jgi:serine/threonine protein kinase
MRGNFTWDEMNRMRELLSVLRMPHHPNIVHLYEIHRDVDGSVSFVFEYMSNGSLLEMIDDRTENKLGFLSNSEIRFLVRQIMLGVQHLHNHGIYHRDLKPENILLGPNNICKVADFSLARESDETGKPTSYVSTRWYRAPEVLLLSTSYTSKVDVWAIGCIIAELYSLEPLFPGRDEIDQLNLIFAVFGTPDKDDWHEGMKLLTALNLKSWQGIQNTETPHSFIEKFVCRKASDKSIRQVDLNVISLILTLLRLNPDHRNDANTALNHSYFTNQENDSKENKTEKQSRVLLCNDSNKIHFFGTTSKPTNLAETNHPVISPHPFEEISRNKRCNRTPDTLFKSCNPYAVSKRHQQNPNETLRHVSNT